MRTFYAAIALSALLATPAFASPADAILDANKAASGGSAWESKETLKENYDLSGDQLTGKGNSLTDLRDGRSMGSYDMGPISGADGFDGKDAWNKDSSGTITLEQGGDERAHAVNDAYRGANLWWRQDRGGAKIVSDGQKTDGGATFDVLTIVPKGGMTFDAWFDGKTHLLMRVLEKRGAQLITTSFSDYRTVDGVKLPFKAVIDDGEGPKYLQTIMITRAEFVPEQQASAYAPPHVTVTDFAIAGGAKEATTPIKVINNHIYADVSVNGKGPFLFIFDTGGANLVTPAVAKELGLKSQGAVDVHGAGEGVMNAGFTKVNSVAIGKASIKSQPFVVLPLDAMSDVEGVTEKGMIGFETFKRFVTRIDYAGGTITLIDPKKFDPKDAGTPVKFVFNGSIPEIQGTFEGEPGKFDIDTGSRAGVTLTKPFAEKIDFRVKHPKGIDCVDGWGVGGPSTGYVARGKMLMLGDVKVPGIVVSYATQKKGAFAGNEYAANIGSGILKRFIVTFDYNNKVMYLKPAAVPLTDVDTFDRSGMWINDSKDGFKIVDVTAKGPADAAGLKTGDVIVSIDGKLAGETTLPDLRKRLRDDAAGAKIKLGLQNGKAVTLTLRDQI